MLLFGPRNHDAAQAAYNRREFRKARRIWHALAQRGDPRAQCKLANLYHAGVGVSQDVATAVMWYRKAAAKGDTEAQAWLTMRDQQRIGGPAKRLHTVPTRGTTPTAVRPAPLVQDPPPLQPAATPKPPPDPPARRLNGQQPNADEPLVLTDMISTLPLPGASDPPAPPPEREPPIVIRATPPRAWRPPPAPPRGPAPRRPKTAVAPPPPPPKSPPPKSSTPTTAPPRLPRQANENEPPPILPAVPPPEVTPLPSPPAVQPPADPDPDPQGATEVPSPFVVKAAAGDPADPMRRAQAAYDAGDYDTARGQWQTLADQGIAEAQAQLAMMYDDGVGVDQDTVQALRWYHRAARQGHPKAQTNLGVIYGSPGPNGRRDLTQAALWTRRAASQAVPRAQYNLGVMYALGDGVPVDFVDAYMWFALADTRGFEEAAAAMAELERHMSPAQRALARSRQKHWRPTPRPPKSAPAAS